MAGTWLAAGNVTTSTMNVLDYIMQLGKKYSMKYFQYCYRKCDIIIVHKILVFNEIVMEWS